MSARDEGRRAAARENPSDIVNPYNPGQERMEFQAGVDDVTAHRLNGLDPEGHQPQRPHLCVTDVTKVCNCCSHCQVKCRSETAPAQKEPDLITLSGWALVRIATVLERMTISANVLVGRRTCARCGSVVSEVNQPCFVCGDKP